MQAVHLQDGSADADIALGLDLASAGLTRLDAHIPSTKHLLDSLERFQILNSIRRVGPLLQARYLAERTRLLEEGLELFLQVPRLGAELIAELL